MHLSPCSNCHSAARFYITACFPCFHLLLLLLLVFCCVVHCSLLVMYLVKLCNHSNIIDHASCSPCCLYSLHHVLIFLYIPATPFIGCMLSVLFATFNIFLTSITNIISRHMAVKFTIIIIIITIISSSLVRSQF